jgi:hypothetical protein
MGAEKTEREYFYKSMKSALALLDSKYLTG